MILIDMPMPSICDECPLKDEYAECAFLHKPVEYLGRLPDCPLCEIAWNNKKCIGGEQ